VKLTGTAIAPRRRIDMSASRRRPARLVLASLTLLMLLWAGGASSAPVASSGLIAFESDLPDGINAAFDVFTMAADGSSLTQITDGGGNEAAWNADGTRIAFSTNGNYGEPRACLRNLFAMNPDGTGKAWILGGEGCSSQATDSCSFNNFPSWSPDGTKIVYAGNDCFASGARVPGGIFVVDVTTRTRTRLTTNQVGLALDADPSWSHDGTKIAFASADALGYHIHVMDADGGNLTKLDAPGQNTGPAWSPDDSKIAFSSSRDGNGEIWVMDADGSDPVQLTQTPGPVVNQNPSWSPDGTRLAFESNRDASPNGTSDFEIWAMNADGSSQTQLTVNNADDRQPDWQPTGEAPPPPPSPGTIRVELDSVPDAPDDFNFVLEVSGGTTSFTLDDDGGSDSTYTAVQEYAGLTAGSRSLHPQDLVVGWQRSLSCTDPDGGSSTTGLTATIDLDPGETVTCRYTHTKEIGTIRIELDAVPNAPDVFQFQGAGPSSILLPFALDDDGGSDSTLVNSREFQELNAGSWSFSPYIPSLAWTLTGLTCTDPDGGSSTNAETGLATIDLDPGESVTCRYTYTDAIAPSLTLPLGVSADATGPNGAVVAYAVSATDNLDPAPTVSCSPLAGSLFPIGDTTVACTAADSTGNIAIGAFRVHVRGAGEQIAALIAKTEAFVDDPRVEAVLRAGLLVASQALAAGRKVLACSTLNAYSAAVRLLPTWILSASRKSQLIADAARIRAVIGC
jgi:Tol biopolymer transport system component